MKAFPKQQPPLLSKKRFLQWKSYPRHLRQPSNCPHHQSRKPWVNVEEEVGKRSHCNLPTDSETDEDTPPTPTEPSPATTRETIHQYLLFLDALATDGPSRSYLMQHVNENGIAERFKREEDFNLLQNHSFDICLLQEIHLSTLSQGESWNREWDGSTVWSPGSNRSRGVGIL